MRRVVITGLGAVTPLGCGVGPTWRRLVAGESGAGVVRHFDASHLPCQIACEIPLGDGADGALNIDDWIAHKDRRKLDRFIVYALIAAQQAVEDSGWTPGPDDREAQ